MANCTANISELASCEAVMPKVNYPYSLGNWNIYAQPYQRHIDKTYAMHNHLRGDFDKFVYILEIVKKLDDVLTKVNSNRDILKQMIAYLKLPIRITYVHEYVRNFAIECAQYLPKLELTTSPGQIQEFSKFEYSEFDGYKTITFRMQ